ncbi:hypothetical protein BDD43_3376 [Mucilaginibacter gracilis]|uniref:Uncharacterized protein n=1 Tax=Mucilaginibacter gracilis TaxID=423350 RepID=A0A495J4A8_9SPHI|nr:hypothetical protein [Mucilaginibacter gracilis]RKR83174.1 hypothetical protein BDD43_3376 [Mucilaginibacter gracilis]
MYSLNFTRIIRSYLATWLAPVRLAWLTALVSPLEQTRDDVFITFRNEAIEKARYNCQTIILQSILNKVFNTGNKTDIYIKNSDEFTEHTNLFNEAEGYPAIYLYNEGEGRPIYLFNESEFEQVYDFVVYVPTAIYNASLDVLKAWIDKYKFSGINYNIIAY